MNTTNTAPAPTSTVSCPSAACASQADLETHIVALWMTDVASGYVDVTQFPGIYAIEYHSDMGTPDASIMQEIVVPVIGGDIRLGRNPGTEWTMSPQVAGEEEMSVSAMFKLAEQMSNAARLAESLNAGTPAGVSL